MKRHVLKFMFSFRGFFIGSGSGRSIVINHNSNSF